MFCIALLGGDERQIYLGQILMDAGHTVHFFAIPKDRVEALLGKSIVKKYKKQMFFHEEEEYGLLSSCDLVLGPIPCTKDQIYLQQTFANKQIPINRLFQNLSRKNYVIAGMIPDNLKSAMHDRGIQYYDYIKNTSFSRLNAIATAEGAISYAINHSSGNLHQSKVLVLGYGLCGTCLAEKCRALMADVTVTGRREETRTLAIRNGMHYLPVNALATADDLSSYSYIFNTIPDRVLTKEILEKLSFHCTIVDIASAPGGLDYDYAKKHQLNATLYLGIPGKIAPEASAQILYDIIVNQIKERSSLYVSQS